MKKSYIKYILSLLLFGSNGIIASHITLGSLEIVFFRTLIGNILLAALFFLSKNKPTTTINKKDILYIAISGIAMGASWMFLYEAYAQLGVSIASLLYYAGPVIVMVLSPLLFKERLTSAKVIGFLVVLCGIVFINSNLLNGNTNFFGVLLGLLSALMYAVMVMANKKSTKIKGLENSLIQLAVSFMTVAIFLGFKSGFVFEVSVNNWTWILILGLLNTGVGCYFYFSSIGNLPVQTVAICGYLEPLSAVVLSVILLHEAMLPLQVVGAVLIVCGAIFGEMHDPRKHKRKLAD